MNEVQKILTWGFPKDIEAFLKQKYTNLVTVTVKKGDGKIKVYFYRIEPALVFFNDIHQQFDEVKLTKRLTQANVIITPNRI